MENVLTFPAVYGKKKKCLFNVYTELNNAFQNLIKSVQRLTTLIREQRKKEFKRKVAYLWFKTYDHYLDKVLKERRNKKVVDFPEFTYRSKMAICNEAVKLTDAAMEYALSFGVKHINGCYKRARKNAKK